MNINRSFLTPVLGALLLAGVAAPAAVVIPLDLEVPPASATEYIEGHILIPARIPHRPGPNPDGSPRYSTMDPLPPDEDPRPEFARFVFRNKFDLDHPKELSFTGTMQFAPDHVPPLAVVVGVSFDWFDPRPNPSDPDGGPIGWVTTDAYAINLAGPDPVTVVVPPGGLPFTIDFCPPQVSIEFFFLHAHPGAHVLFNGDFTHTCIPEPAAAAAAFGMALGGFALWRRLRSK